MKFRVEQWDPAYGASLDGEMVGSSARIDAEVEVGIGQWAPIKSSDVARPEAVIFVDGVRRIDARVWIDGDSLGICASYAAGAVCCNGTVSSVTSAEVRRSLVTVSTEAVDISTRMGTYRVEHTVAGEVPIPLALSNALQRQLADLEVTAAVAARGKLETTDDLLVIDGPLRSRAHLPRTIGYIKTHHAEYLPQELNGVVAQLDSCERTPVFLIGSNWDRYAWYLRLPCPVTMPWAGVVRIEAASHLPAAEVISLANLTQVVLPRFASVEYKDSRAPQNLFPIAGLEKALRHRLGDMQVLYRAVRAAAG